MSNQDELLTVDQAVDHDIKMGLALERLKRNEDFKNLITNGYLKEKALASVSLLAVPQIKEQGRRTDIMEDLIASSNLEYFLQMVEQRYEGAKNPILSDQEIDEMAAAEEAEEAKQGMK